MYRFFFTVFLLLPIYCSTILADTNTLEFKLLGGGKKEVEPGSSVNVIVMITNRTDTYKSFKIQLKSREDNIKLIADYSSLRVEKKSSTNKILGIQIPSNYKAGDVSIELEAIENTGKQTFGSASLPMVIKAKYEIEVSKPVTPSFLFAGDTAKMSYIVQNLSNVDVMVKTIVVEGLKSNESTLKIPKDSSVVLKYLVHVPKNLQSYSQQSIMMTAGIVNKPESDRSMYSSIEVFPTTNVKFDRYERFPIKVAGFGLVSNRLGRMAYSTLYDVKGIGFLGKNTDKKLEFHMRGPDRTGNPLFGLNDEYYLKYTTKHFDVAVGDYNFGLSELTESSRNGQGLKLQYKLKKWAIGGFYNKPRYYPLVKDIYSAFSSYSFNTKNIITLGFLNKADTLSNDTRLLSLAANNKPFSWLNTNFEVAAGQTQVEVTKAYKAGLGIQNKLFSANVNYMFADPTFPGFVNNSTRFFSGLTFQIKKINFSMNYDLNSTNFALDTLYGNMPYSENVNLTASFRLSQNSNMTLGGFSISLKDRSSQPLFDYSKVNARMSLQSKISDLNVTLVGDVGQMTNRLGKTGLEKSFDYNGTFSLGYELSKALYINAFTTYQGGEENVTGNVLFYYGCTMMVDLNNTFSASLQYNSDYEWRYYTSDRSLLSLNIGSHINPNNELTLVADYNLKKNTLKNKEYNVQLRYTHTFNFPIAKKKDVGSVSGKIINHGVERVAGIRLNLNGRVTITDKNGNFKFVAIPVGTYTLGIDESSFGLNAVTETPGPYQVVVTPSKLTQLEFAMTRSARIEGKLTIQEDERLNQKGYIPIKEQVERLIVEATNDVDIFRVYSDKDGIFSFDDLRPGSWKVKVYPNGLPAGYQLITSQFNINLASGKQEKIDVLIQKKARQIKFQTTKK